MRRLRHVRAWIAVGAALGLPGSSTRAEERKTFNVDDLLRSVVPAPNTRAIAAREGMPIGKEALAPAAATAATGDSVTALVQLASFHGNGAPKQWVVRLRMAAATKGPAAATRDVTYFTNSGDQFVFHSGISPMALDTLGPVEPETEVAAHIIPRSGHVQASADFLTLDIRRAAGVIAKLSDGSLNPKHIPYHISAGTHAYPERDWDATRAQAAALGITVDDRRSFAGSLPALGQFFDIARRTPDLQAILLQVIEMPSVIDALRHGGRQDIGFDFLGGGGSVSQDLFWPHPGDGNLSELFFNIEVFGKPVLTVILFVTEPYPPLEASAGILGAVALPPTRADKYVAIRIFSSHSGTGAHAPPPAN